MSDTSALPSPVLVVGSVNVDHVLRVEHLPRPGETLLAHDLASLPGGKGANQAVAAARLSGVVRLVAAVGDDAAGEGAVASLAAAGVDVAGVARIPGRPTGQAFICVAADGENAIVVAAGANAALSPAHLAGRLEGAAVVLCQLETPRETIEAAFAQAPPGGLRMLNAAPAEAWARALVPHCDVLVVNETELATLGGGEAHAALDLAEAAARLQLRADQTLVLTLGAAGVAALWQGEAIRVPGRPAQVVDTTGAGDCFCGILAALLAEGRLFTEALAAANVAAALSVGRPGAQAGVPTRAELEAALAQLSDPVAAA